MSLIKTHLFVILMLFSFVGNAKLSFEIPNQNDTKAQDPTENDEENIQLADLYLNINPNIFFYRPGITLNFTAYPYLPYPVGNAICYVTSDTGFVFWGASPIYNSIAWSRNEAARIAYNYCYAYGYRFCYFAGCR